MRQREADAAIENLAEDTANDLDVALLVQKVQESEAMQSSAETSELERSSRQVTLVFPKLGVRDWQK